MCRKTLKAPRPTPHPQIPVTLGDHLKKRRLELGLLQHQVAQRTGVSVSTVMNWENGHTRPTIRDWPQVITFLGYDAVPIDYTVAGRLLAFRRRRGLTQRELARGLGVDPTTLSRWELGLRVPRGEFWARIERFGSRQGS